MIASDLAIGIPSGNEAGLIRTHRAASKGPLIDRAPILSNVARRAEWVQRNTFTMVAA